MITQWKELTDTEKNVLEWLEDPLMTGCSRKPLEVVSGQHPKLDGRQLTRVAAPDKGSVERMIEFIQANKNDYDAFELVDGGFIAQLKEGVR